MSEPLLEEIQKSIYIALESADAATDAVKEIGRIKHDVIERSERMVNSMKQVHRRALMAIGALSVVGVVALVVALVLMLSTKSEFERIGEVSREALKTYIGDVNTLTAAIKETGSPKEQLEALTAALGAQQREAADALALQKEMFEGLTKEVKGHQEAVTSILSKPLVAAAPARVQAAPKAAATADAELSAINQRLRVLQQLVERLPRTAPAAAPGARGADASDARILAQQQKIMDSLADLIRAQNSALQIPQKQKSALSYP